MKEKATFKNLKYVSGGGISGGGIIKSTSDIIKSTICTTAALGALGVVATSLYKNLKNEDNFIDKADKYIGQKAQEYLLDNFIGVNDKEDNDE